MTYDVVWLPATEQELTAIWLGARDRQAVTEAANTIDERLRADAANEGESRSDDERVTFSRPLAVRYHLSPGTRTVQVLRVWPF